MNNTKAKYDVFQAIADPKRRKIIKLLADNEKSIKSITQDFNISRTAVNKHLNILYQAELVTKK
ncbi:metalloregulator ArsR/SmtB family transcription factor, partial [Staphylococcus capitis]|uniref:ArsR/SmtB family transcription factor n=2 Tax=Bacillales TaxID=1385 RepID=UPI00248024A3